MVAILIAFGLVGGIVKLAIGQADDPTIRRFLQKRRLAILASKANAKLSLPEAEDGLALARHFEDKFLQVRFAKLVASMKHSVKTHPRRHP